MRHSESDSSVNSIVRWEIGRSAARRRPNSAAPRGAGGACTPFSSTPRVGEGEVIFMAPMVRQSRSSEQMQRKKFLTVTVFTRPETVLVNYPTKCDCPEHAAGL